MGGRRRDGAEIYLRIPWHMALIFDMQVFSIVKKVKLNFKRIEK